MEIDVGFFKLFDLGFKYVRHRFLQYCAKTNETVIVKTSHGNVKGVKRKTIYELPYYAFEGIPFAKPPIGELRFKAPQPPAAWNGILDCTYIRSKAMQRHLILKIVEGSEDCLYLNVYVKTLKSEKKLPVIVWLHGGGFQIGESSRDIYSPDYFMEKDIVLVSVSYRLGALGFLSLSDPDLKIPGNAGLKDQLMALKWINQNCANFNGDPSNITLLGESAGGVSVEYLMLTDKAKGLFQKAIIMSGSVLCPWSYSIKGDWSYRLAKEIGYNGINDDKLVYDFLSKVNARQLVGPEDRLQTAEEKFGRFFFAFAPCIEPYESDDALVTKSTLEMMKTAWGNRIPLIIGGASFEGLIMYQKAIKEPKLINLLDDCESLLPMDLNLPRDSEKSREFGQKLKDVYFGGKKPEIKEHLFNYLDLLSYQLIWHSMHRSIVFRLTYSSQSTYLYRFDFDSPDFNHYRVLKCGQGVRGTSHADDLSYLFFNATARKLPEDSPELRTIHCMIGIFAAFAETADPNCEEIKPNIWKPLEKYSPEEAFNCLNISDDIEIKSLPEFEKLKLWDSFYSREQIVG